MILKFKNIFAPLRSKYHKMKDLSKIKSYLSVMWTRAHEWPFQHTHTKHTQKQNIPPILRLNPIIYIT